MPKFGTVLTNCVVTMLQSNTILTHSGTFIPQYSTVIYFDEDVFGGPGWRNFHIIFEAIL